MQSVYSNIVIKILSEKDSAMDGATLYEIQVATPYNRWFLSKKYDEFSELHSNLEQFYHALPQFPQQSILDMIVSHFTDEKQNRKQKLQQYLQALVVRKDVLASDFVVEFLQMMRNSPQLVSASPILRSQYSIDKDGDYPTKGIRDFYYDHQQQTFIILTADMNAVSRMNSFLINTKLPWDEDNIPTLLQVGSVECWKCIQSNGQRVYKKIWTKIYPSQAIIIEYSKSKERLYVGLDSGQIDELKVSATDGYTRVQTVRSLQVHEERVTGIFLDSLNGVMYSISDDGYLHSVQMLNCYKIMSVPHDLPLSCILADSINKRIFIGADEGHIFLYDVSSKGFPKLMITIITPQDGPIKSLALDLTRNYLFTAGFEDGLIAVFDLDKPGKQKLTKQIAMFQGKQNLRRLAWISQKMQIICGMENGTICFWDTLAGEPVYLFEAHQDEISKLYYNSQERTLITASKGQQIKFWEIPKHWRDIKNVQMEEDKIEERRKVDNALKIKEKVRRVAEDSDDDDLRLWYKTPQNSDSSQSQDLF